MPTLQKETLSTKEYWTQSIPMSFVTERYSYLEKREFRYSLQDYMAEAFEFHKFTGQLVLDLGCGSGIDSAEFAQYGAEVVSIDLTRKACELTHDLMIEAEMEHKVIQASVLSLPFKDGSFDCIYCFGVLHHIPTPEFALAEVSRVLKPGGKVMVMLYHKDSLLYGYSIIYHRGVKEKWLNLLSEEELLSKFSERNEDCPYTRAYTRDEALSLFSPWFKDIEIGVYYKVIDLPEERKIKLPIPDSLGWHLVVKGRKNEKG